MLWATRSGISFFGGFNRLPLPPGKKGCVVALAVVAVAVAVLLGLAYFFGFGGVVAYVAVGIVLVWRPLSRLEKETRAHQAALQEELRNAAAESDTEFHVH
jgi:fatty acid desaturase